MTWTTFSFSDGQFLTALNLNLLQANFASMGAGELGAPKLKAGTLNSSAVTRSKLKTATASLSGTLNPFGGTGTATLTLNAYAFFPMLYSANGAFVGAHTSSGTEDQPRLSVTHVIGDSYKVAYRYVDA